MKIRRLLLLVCLLTVLLSTVLADEASAPTPGNIILCSVYLQAGWGDLLQVGFVDQSGACFYLTGSAGELGWPYKEEEQLSYLSTCPQLEYLGKLSGDDLHAIKSLINTTEKMEEKSHPAACDAGTEMTYAIRYDRDGTKERILLGMSGDDAFENTCVEAQALYRDAHTLFPAITCYAYHDLIMGPQGFTPVPLSEFLDLPFLDFSQVAITALNTDCEEGLLPVELTEKDHQYIRNLIQHGQVTGKANSLMVTGGTTIISFSSLSGTSLCTVELYQGLLVTSDGMYHLSVQE